MWMYMNLWDLLCPCQWVAVQIACRLVRRARVCAPYYAIQQLRSVAYRKETRALDEILSATHS